MGLLVWLPLNGDLRNQGLAQVTVTVSGDTSYEAGKIGQGLSCNGSSFWTVNNINLGSSCSIACWTKTSVTKKMSWVLSSDASRILNLYESFIYTLNTGDSDNNPFKNNNNENISCLNDGLWHHFVVTFDSSTAKLYIDGIYAGTALRFRNPTTTNGVIRIGGGFNNGHTYDWNGMLNDFRVYDHALSPREIKEISKGLILHYPLNHCAGENLLKESNVPVTNSSYLTKSFYFGDNPPLEGEQVTIQLKGHLADTKSYWNIYNSGEQVNVITLPKTSYNADTGIYTVTGNWVLTKNTTTASNKYISVYAFTSSQSGESTIEWIKMERGDKATPWIPNPTDTLYSTMGLDNNIEYDVSGYGRNGQRSGTTYSFDTARYLMSTNFNGTTDGVIISNLDISNILNNQCTISFWIKPNGENGVRSVYFSAYSSTSWSIGKKADNKLRLYWNGNPDISTTLAITDGVWQHIAITKNGTNEVKIYLNGLLIQSLTNTHNNLTFGTTWRLGRDTRSNDGTPYKGLMSDFRIYATALSADDILELYHTSASITNSGVLMTQGELSEV